MRVLFNRIKRILNDREGVAMTEVLVAFLVMMIGLSMLYTCMKLSSGLIMKSADMDRNHVEYQRSLEGSLSTASYPSTGSGSVTYVFTGGYSLTLPSSTITATDSEGNTRNVPVFAVE